MMKSSVFFMFFCQVCIVFSQTFNIAGIDSTAFPTISTHALLLNSVGGSYSSVTPSDFTLTENGIDLSSTLQIVPVDNLTDKTISIVLVIEQSQYMNREVATGVKLWDWVKEEVEYFITNYKFAYNTKMALIGFNALSNVYTDLTNDKTVLKDKFKEMQPIGTTLYDDVFTNQGNGAPALLRKAPPDKHRFVIFLTGKKPVSQIAELAIYNNLQINNSQLYVINLCMEEKNTELNSIALQSGGKAYTTDSKAGLRSSFETIKSEMSKNLPLHKLTWTSRWGCSSAEMKKDLEIGFIPQYAKINYSYSVADSMIAGAATVPSSMSFGSVPAGTLPTQAFVLSSTVAPLTVDNAYITPSTFFSIKDWGGTEPPFVVQPGQSRTITVQFDPTTELDYRRAYFVVDGGPCPPIMAIDGGNETTTLVGPLGGELYSLCDKINIKWASEDKYRNVRLYYSSNNGSSWITIKSDTFGVNMYWSAPTRSNSYRVMVSPVPKPSYTWLKGFGGSDIELCSSLVMAKKGIGFYIAGTFSGKMEIDSQTYQSNGRSDIFVARFDPDCNLEWIRTSGGPNDDQASGLCIDDNDNVYVIGSIRNGFKIGAMTLSTYSQSNPYCGLIRYDRYGENPGIDIIGPVYPNPESKAWGLKIAYNNSRLYVRGQFIGNIDKGDFRLTYPTPNNMTNPVIFTALYDTTMIVDTMYRYGTNYAFYTTNTATSPDGYRYTAGNYTGNMTLDRFTINSNNGSSDVFLQKYGTNPTGYDRSDSSFRVQGPILSLTKDTLDFGNVLLSDSLEILSDTLFCNVGTHDMTMNSITLVGPDRNGFSFDPGSKTIFLTPDECYTFPIVFKPFKNGVHNAALALSGDCYNYDTISLRGTGLCGFKGSDYVDMDKVTLDSTKSVTETCILNNINTFPVKINPTLEGINADEFTIDSIGTRTLKAGECLRMNVTFTPKALGVRNAMINYHITDTTCSSFETYLIGEGVEETKGVTDEPNTTIRNVSVNPNPAETNFTVSFSLNTPEQVSVVLYNSLGERMTVLMESQLATGMYRLESATEDMAPGVYFIRIMTSSTETIEKVVIRK